MPTSGRSRAATTGQHRKLRGWQLRTAGSRVVKYDEPSSLTTSLSNVTQGPGLVRKRIKRIVQVRKIKRIASQSGRAGHIVFLQCSSAILPSSPRKHADG